MNNKKNFRNALGIVYFLGELAKSVHGGALIDLGVELGTTLGGEGAEAAETATATTGLNETEEFTEDLGHVIN